MNLRDRSRLFWRLQIGGWLFLVPFSTGVAMVAFDDPGNIVLTGVVRQVLAFGLTIALWHFYRRWSVETFKLASHAWQIVLACLAVTVLDAVLIESIRLALDLPPPPVVAQRGALVARLALYLAWSALYFMIRQELWSRDRELRVAQVEAAARKAELATLRAQVNPHFIFNVLASIQAECVDNPRAVLAITRALADYLRGSLLQQGHHAPLGDEVEAMAGYLRVEQMRFEEKFVATLEVEAAARAVSAPTAVLLPLVENAVKYGLRTSPVPLRVNVRAVVREGRLIIAVENSGRWVEPQADAVDSTQIGLANLRRRLALLHGEAATLHIDSDEQGVRVTVTLPATVYTPLPSRHA